MTQLLKSRALLPLRVNRYHNNGISSLFDCVMPSVNGCDLEEPKVDSVVLQNNTVSINAEAPLSFVTAELSYLKYVDILFVW